MRRNRKVPFNCYLSVDQLDALDRVSEEEGRPRAEIVREAVETYLAAKSNTTVESEADEMSENVREAEQGDPQHKMIHDDGASGQDVSPAINSTAGDRRRRAR